MHGEQLFAFANLRATGAVFEWANVVEGIHRMGTDDPIRLMSDVALELTDSDGRPVTEETILFARVEAERVQLALELPDIVPPELGRPQVQSPIAESVTGFDELPPGVGPHHTVDAEAAQLLEGTDRGEGGRAEASGAPFSIVDRTHYRAEAVMDVVDLGPLVS
jgi:hypothetical protein